MRILSPTGVVATRPQHTTDFMADAAVALNSGDRETGLDLLRAYLRTTDGHDVASEMLRLAATPQRSITDTMVLSCLEELLSLDDDTRMAVRRAIQKEVT